MRPRRIGIPRVIGFANTVTTHDGIAPVAHRVRSHKIHERLQWGDCGSPSMDCRHGRDPSRRSYKVPAFQAIA